MSRKLAAGVVIIGGIFLAVIALVGVSLLTGSVAIDENADYSVRLAMLTVPVVDDEPIQESPDQYLGVYHQTPNFETADLGPELTFRQDTTDLDVLESRQALRAVYLGHDQAGQPYYIWHAGSPDFRRLLGQIVADLGSFGRLGSSYGSLVTGGGLLDSSLSRQIGEQGLATGSVTGGSDQVPTLVAEWHGLPPEVAVVAFSRDLEPLGWQNPISGTAALRLIDGDLDLFAFDVSMVAFTAEGEEWNRWP